MARQCHLDTVDLGDEVQAIKAGLLEVADLVVVNKGDRPGAMRTASQLRAMLAAAPQVGRDGGDASDLRPRPKRPEVLVTTASTGAGVKELLRALDRTRPPAADDGGHRPVTHARLMRAEAQVWAVVVDRLRARLREPGRWPLTEETLRAVAAHELDPYAAADRLLRSLTDHPDGAPTPEGATNADATPNAEGPRAAEPSSADEEARHPEAAGDAGADRQAGTGTTEASARSDDGRSRR